MPIQSVERTAAPDDILATLERDGVVIIRELIDQAAIQDIMGRVAPRLAKLAAVSFSVIANAA